MNWGIGVIYSRIMDGIKVLIPRRIVKKLQTKAKKIGTLNDRTFMEGKGNIVGLLGEWMFLQEFDQFSHDDEFSHDFSFNGWKIDVKTKYQRVDNDPLTSKYEASIASYLRPQYIQGCDIYVFSRVFKKDNSYPYGWLLGWITKKDFFEKARFLPKGKYDGNNGYQVRNNCYNLYYHQLNPMDTLIKRLRKKKS